jgi:hypothetical protein
MSGSGRRGSHTEEETDETDPGKLFGDFLVSLTGKRPFKPSPAAALALERGIMVRSIVIKAATEALAITDENSKEAKRLRKLQEDFLSSFDAFAFDSRIPKSSRPAALGAILNALFIGLFSDDPDRRIRIIREFEQLRAAQARAARDEKFAPEKEKTLAAVREAMQATAAKPTRGVGYAKKILPKVVKRLKRDVSQWRIRDLVRVVLEEAPGKQGRS